MGRLSHNYHHFSGGCGALWGLKWRRFWLEARKRSHDSSECLVAIFSVYFLNALKNGNNSNIIHVIGHKYVILILAQRLGLN